MAQNLVTPQPFGSFFSCLSVTVLPTIVSDLTGLPMMLIFKILIPLTATLVIVGVFLLVRQLFNARVAALSAFVFLLSANTGLLSQLLRENVAIFLLLLCGYLLFLNFHTNKRSGIFLAIIFLLIIPTAHYTIIYFTILFLFVLFIAERFGSNIVVILTQLRVRAKNSSITEEKRVIVPILPVFLIACMGGFLWLLYIGSPIFGFDLTTATSALRAVSGVVPSHYSYQTQSALVSYYGTGQTVMNWVIRGLTIVGLFIALRFSKNVRSLGFALWGAIIFILLAIDLILPNLNETLALDRVYLIGMIAFSAFIALAFVELPKLIGKVNFKWRSVSVKWITVVFSVVIIVAMFLLSFGPMTYLPESSATLNYSLSVVPLHYTSQDFAFASFIQTYTKSLNCIFWRLPRIFHY